VPNELTATRSRGAFCLWAGAAVLIFNGAYLWMGKGNPGALGAWYLSNVLFHLGVGRLLLPVFLVWCWRRRLGPEWRRGLGLGGLLLLASALSGVSLVVLGNRGALQPLLWSHVALAIAGLVVLLASVASRYRGGLRRLSGTDLLPALLVPGLVLFVQAGAPPGDGEGFNAGNPGTMADEAMGGEAGPFYPSALHTRNGSLLPASAVAASQSCGRSGCHPDELAEWSASAHRFSGLDNPWYRRTYEEMRRTRGAVSARWCGGCHTPALLASGGMDQPVEEVIGTPAATAGVSCTVCHIARVRSTRGQADLELDVPDLHTLSMTPGFFARTLHDLLVRIDPEPHRRIYSRYLVADSSSELCSACHKASMDRSVNNYLAQSVMNDYDPWQTTSGSGQGMTQSIYFPSPQSCVDCHMAGREPGRRRSHRFTAANTALPALRGDRKQLAAVTEFLQAGRVTLDIFAMTKGRPIDAPAQNEPEEVYAPIDRLPATLRRGESTRFDIVVRTRGVGHRFPGGKDVPKDCWLEVRAIDDRGKTTFWNGKATESTAVDPRSHFLSGLWIDQNGHPINGYEIWNNHIEMYSKRLEANTTALGLFRINVPASAGGRLTVTARLLYRKFPMDFTRWVFTGPGAAGLGLPPMPVVPIVTLAETSITLPVVDAGAPLPDMTHPVIQPSLDAERWNDYAFALANQAGYARSRQAFQTSLALKPDDAEVWTTLGNLEWAVREYAAARPALERALQLNPSLARARYYLGIVERDEGHRDQALAQLRAAAALYPRDVVVLADLGRVLLQNAEYREAVAVLERAAAINPADPGVHFMLTMGHRALGNARESKAHEVSFDRFKMSGDSNTGVIYLNAHPEVRTERRGLHEHESMPLDGVDDDAP